MGLAGEKCPVIFVETLAEGGQTGLREALAFDPERRPQHVIEHHPGFSSENRVAAGNCRFVDETLRSAFDQREAVPEKRFRAGTVIRGRYRCVEFGGNSRSSSRA